jgi:DNA-binding NarL/FixJ family response regulator
MNLTPCELEIMQHLANGLSTKQIAPQINYTEYSVEAKRIRIMKKLKTPNTAALIAYGFRNNLIK